MQTFDIRKVLKAGVAYFSLVFGSGFVLGTIRILIVVPRVGERNAELMELPLMLLVIVLAAGWVVRRFEVPSASGQRLGVGFIALSLLLIFEFVLVLKLRGITLAEYFRDRDPIAGTAYYISLLLFALMPSFVAKRLG